ncbi:aldehyde dehydrogenase (NADP(+)) [uncultured Algimonas sp.]|uniref:aldehyde dehydrogenase (NADP(+)) n=1 Tax=uncultured Algimonas sp. TaxID=1547920 RepID=UPI0026355CE5|nr:aldehyde dehydrogenase (NADP(+)) [uncultured Algimonas sp.]
MNEFRFPTRSMVAGLECNSGSGRLFRGFNPATDKEIEPAFESATLADVDQAAKSANDAFPVFRRKSSIIRAGFLEAIASELQSLGDVLIDRTIVETGLPRQRVAGELARTCGQLAMFADMLREEMHLRRRSEDPLPERKPQPRPSLKAYMAPLGPVAVFGASNFPLAFSVAGGDTASALAAGCPVIVKAHSAHPGTSALVGDAIGRAVASCGLPPGVFSLLFDDAYTIGEALVRNPYIKAVGFTGSRAGGEALMKIAQSRKEPIPVFAEMSSINPVVILPAALKSNPIAISTELSAAMRLGAGQFCTSPGVVFAIEGPGWDAFVGHLSESVSSAEEQTMLTPEIAANFVRGVDKRSGMMDVDTVPGSTVTQGCQAVPVVHIVNGDRFKNDGRLHEEIFGSAVLIVKCQNLEEIINLLSGMEGQLTVSLHFEEADYDQAKQVISVAESIAGRLIANGFGTGVEVSHAMVHGGPYPATSDSRSTSVGSWAIERFQRPLCYQNFPISLLPEALHGSEREHGAADDEEVA